MAQHDEAPGVDHGTLAGITRPPVDIGAPSLLVSL